MRAEDPPPPPESPFYRTASGQAQKTVEVPMEGGGERAVVATTARPTDGLTRAEHGAPNRGGPPGHAMRLQPRDACAGRSGCQFLNEMDVILNFGMLLG